MRLFPGADRALIVAALALVCAVPAAAQQQPTPVQTQQMQIQQALQALAQMQAQQQNAASQSPTTEAGGQKFADRAAGDPSFLQSLKNALGMGVADKDKEKEKKDDPAKKDLGRAEDPNSSRAKVNRLADRAVKERERVARAAAGENTLELPAPPPEMEALQAVNETFVDADTGFADATLGKDVSLDMRKESQREAALSYGARGGLAKRGYQIMEKMQGLEPALDRIFNFRALLIRAPSGLLIEPPIIREASNALVITEGGTEAAVADEIYDINKAARIVSAPRDWRQYLLQSWTEVPPPPRILWPKDDEEQARWNMWVAQGWKAGVEQADQIFETSANRLATDYAGMIRYRALLAQGMVSQPYALHEDRGITGDRTKMRVGDRALRITGPSQFLNGTDSWTPADR